MDALAKRAHFLRRASYGGTMAELNSNTGTSDLLNQWLESQAIATVPRLGAAERNGKVIRNQTLKFADWLVTQTIYAENPLQQKMVNFWRDHFVVSARKVRFPQLLTDYETRLRTHVFGDFRELLWSVTTSPAMLSYLDNENCCNLVLAAP